MIRNLEELRDEVNHLRESGVQRGRDTGFKCLDELYSVKEGSFSIFLGAPTHGKSEVIFELILNQSIKFGDKGLILSPETGKPAQIVMELLHKYIGKSAYSTNPYHCTELEYNTAFNWVNYHFVIADDEKSSYSFDELISQIDKYERDHKCVFKNFMAEPWNELNHKIALQQNSGRQDLAIEDELTQLRRYCDRTLKHAFLSFHPSFQSLVKDQQSGLSYYEMPKAREAAGGQATLRKAFSWINIWRPPVGVIDPTTGVPYADNEVFLQVEKSKPKGIGKKGLCRLYWDWKKNRYYENVDGRASYAFEHEKSTPVYHQTSILPSKEFEKAPF